MIEVIYSGETKKPKTQAEETLAALKNIRQIGIAGGSVRIYVEDSVMGFLNRQMQKNDPKVAALLGRELQMDEMTYLFVDGALLAEGIAVKGEVLEFSSQAFTGLYEDMEVHFPQKSLIGWYLPAYSMITKYGTALSPNSRLFLSEDPAESEEGFYLWEQNRLIRQNGYYVYYQRNEEMKRYLNGILDRSSRKEEEKVVVKENITPPDHKELSGTEHKKVRWILKNNVQKEQDREFVDDYQENDDPMPLFQTTSSKLTTFLYAASTVLAIVVLVIGITLINNYEKMYEMQEAIETIATSIMSREAPDSAAKTDGEDVSVQEPAETQANDVDPENETSALDPGPADPAVALQDSLDPDLQTYTIQKGDTLVSISRKLYQTADRISDIKQLNEGLNENELVVGEKIVLP